MATKAPTPAGQGHQGDWYVPVIGMGAGSVIGDGMQALKAQWADTLRRLPGRAGLPTTEGIANLSGGLNAPTQTISKVRELDELLKAQSAMSGTPARVAEEVVGEPAHAFGRMVGKTRTGSMLRPSVENVGGMVPEQEVLDRVMSAGMRDKILGMGAMGGAMPPVTLPPPGVEQGGRNDVISKLLGVSYPGYKIMRANTGNNNQNEQLRQLGFGN